MTEMTAPTPAPSAPQDEPSAELGFVGKLWNLYVNPRQTFAAVGRNHAWIILWLVVAAVSIAAYMPIKPIVQKDQIARVEEQLNRNPQMSAEQRQEILDRVRSQFDNPLYLLFVPVTQLIVVVIVAGILLFIGNILLGGNTSYLKILNAYAWTMMVAIPASIVTVPLAMAKGSMDVSLGLGALTSPETGAFIKTLLSSFEVFALWQVWLSSLAVSVLAGVESGKAFASVFTAWVIWVLIKSGLAMLGLSFGM
ncbi:MAG: YIP1 family protein [Candidatus Zixiibacteriota bacterium]